ncbi:glycosyltransferase family A protein [uncultured Piscinibacter sp.]|uniref:glycosyltransferase family 2 protein n=1 Tax=uncultured Piscinibacter sp. TaxID=1131835 RepID=UPI002626158B|nr:glycosyltransferase family A protein [uncultured Piscinibacter sp.]
MSFRARARRYAAAVRLAIQGPPIHRLLRLLRRGRSQGVEYCDLCLQLGLGERATTGMRDTPEASKLPSMAIRLAALLGKADEAVELARSLAARLPDPAIPRRDIDAAMNCTAPLAPAVALDLIRASGRPSAAEAALLLRLGERDACETHLEAHAELLGPQRWLLWANLQPSAPRQLEGLNRFLQANGLSRVRLLDAAKALAVGNIDVDGTPATPARNAVKLSVVMTCFDCADYVEAAVRSVLGQHHRDLELIAVDDASRDQTWQRLVAMSRTDTRLRPVRLKRNLGTYAAKNIGLALVQGDVIAFNDADDWSCPERFGLCLEVLRRRPWVQAVSCEYIRLQDDGLFWSSLVWPMQRRTPNSIVFRRQVLQRIGYFDEHRFGSDGEYFTRLQVAFGPRSLYRLGRPLIVAASRENSLMTAAATGLDSRGRSQARARFQESWTERLLQQALAGASLYRAAQSGTAEAIAETT